MRQVLLHDTERSMTARIALEELAMSVLTYEMAEVGLLHHSTPGGVSLDWLRGTYWLLPSPWCF
jgi:hypothetical protein